MGYVTPRVRGRARRRRDRRGRRARHHAVRRLPRRPGHDRRVVPRRLVPHRRPRAPRRGRPVHLRRAALRRAQGRRRERVGGRGRTGPRDAPGVADVAVVGAPDPIHDEVPVAFVVAGDGRRSSDALRSALEAWCAERLGKAKRPRDYRFVDELPRTSVGKIKKYVLMAHPGAAHQTGEQDGGGRDDRAQRRPAGEPRRLGRRRRQGVDAARRAVHVAGGAALRARHRVRPRVAVRRPGRADPQPGRLVHDHVR